LKERRGACTRPKRGKNTETLDNENADFGKEDPPTQRRGKKGRSERIRRIKKGKKMGGKEHYRRK